MMMAVKSSESENKVFNMKGTESSKSGRNQRKAWKNGRGNVAWLA